MPARQKTLAASTVLFAGPSPAIGPQPATLIKELYNILSVNYSITNNSETISALGQYAPIGRDSLEQPEVTLDFEYNLSNFDNENRIGLVVNGLSGCLAKILNGTEDEKNYYKTVAPLGVDGYLSPAASNSCISIGNGVLASYNFSAQVGSYPTASVSVAGLHARGHLDSTSEQNPAIDPATGLEVVGNPFTLPLASGNAQYGRDALLRPGDINVNFNNVSGLFYNLSGACISAVNISFDLGRTAQQCLGNRYAKARDITPPIEVTTSITFDAPDIVTGSMSQYFCGTGLYSATISANRPSCYGGGALAVKYTILGMRFNSQSESVALGVDGTTVTMDFISSIGSASDAVNNLIMSGVYN